ncbi:MAG: DUF2637 domain-containing protein [Acidimicrobiales bacterium]
MSLSEVIDLSSDGAAPAELQAAARDAYRQAAATGEAPTGAELGRRFGRSQRWGRARIAECRSDGDGTTPATAAMPADRTGSRAPATARPHGDGNGDGHATAAVVVPLAPAGNRETDPEGMWSRRAIRWVTSAAVIVVAACAARSSYEHQRTVVEMAGNDEAAWYLPLSVDGMMLIASLNMLVRRWDGEPAGWLTWTALLLGGAASLAANIAAAPPTWIGRLVAAWSPVCLILSYELLMQQLPRRAAGNGNGTGKEGA